MGIYTPNSPYPFPIRPQSPNPRIRRPEDATLVRYGDIRYLLQNGVGGGATVDTTAAEIYDMAVNEKLNPGTSYRITDYKSVNYLNGYTVARENYDNGSYSPNLVGTEGSILNPYNYNLNFNNGPNGQVQCIFRSQDGSYYVGGNFTNFNGYATDYKVIKLNSDGTINNTWSAGIPDYIYNWTIVYAIAEGPDGGIYIGGSADFTGTDDAHIIKVDPNTGAIDPTFNAPKFDDKSAIYAIAVQPDGKVVIGGDFTLPVDSFLRLNANGSVDSAFVANIGASAVNGVEDLVLLSDGSIIIVGAFSTFNGNPASGICKVNSNGIFDTTFATNAGTGFNGAAYSIKQYLNTNSVVIGGAFSTYNGVASQRVIKITSTGTIALAWNNTNTINNTVYVVEVQSNGKIFIGGDFTTVNGNPSDSLIRITSNGGPDVLFQFTPTFSPGEYIYALSYNLTTTAIFVGGIFSLCNNISVGNIAALATDYTYTVGYNPLDIHIGDPEVIVIEAISSNRFAPQGYSETYGDIVEFNPICNTVAFPLNTGLDSSVILPNGDPATGFDLQWDGQNAYFMMPTGYPILFGHLFYINFGTVQGLDFEFMTDPILPGINFQKENYSPEILSPYIIVSNDGMKITLPSVTYAEFIQYDPGSLYVDVCVVPQSVAYGQMNRRTDVVRQVSAPLDWRNFRYRVWQFQVTTGNYFCGSTGDTIPYGSITNGIYKDFAPIGDSCWNLDIGGIGGTTGFWWYTGTFDKSVIEYGNDSNIEFRYLSYTYINNIFSSFANLAYVFNFTLGFANNSSFFMSYSGGLYFGFVNSLNVYAVNDGDYSAASLLGTDTTKRLIRSTTSTVFLEYFDGVSMQYATSPF